jgi:hypothetical protein
VFRFLISFLPNTLVNVVVDWDNVIEPLVDCDCGNVVEPLVEVVDVVESLVVALLAVFVC